jgi:ferric-dicitrate binding protein FerR (iron transport regulator)
MTLAFPSPEFDDTVAAACHGSATEAELRAVNELLRRDPSARDEYLFRIELHSRLASEPDLFSYNTRPVRASTTPRPAPPGWRIASGSAPRRPVFRRRGVRQFALAACLVLAAAGIWGLGWKWAPVGRRATSTAVAMLTRAVDAQWAEGKERPRLGGALKPGWLQLRSGLAQVVFYSGARVVIEGPADLRLVSANEAACPNGRLLAEVPEPARGFRLSTDQLNLVDLGTSFGIDANPRQTELHVFKGKVELRPGTRAKQSLSERQAAVVQGNAAPRLMAASAAAFSSMFEFQQRSLASEAFRYERWQFANAQLNGDPSLVVHLDFENLSGADWTVRNAAERNRSVPEATIVGGVRAEGRWREKQALEFHSVNDRVRLVVPGDFDAVTLSAWVCVKGLDRKFNSLFMCDGFAPGTIHWLIRNDGVLGLTVIGTDPGRFQILASPPVLALEDLGVWLHLAVVLDGRNRQVVHYVNGEPVSRHGLRLGPPFRLGASELGNWNAGNDPAPTPFLIRNLSGAIDEFALFSRAWSDAEIRELHAQGKP